MPRVFISHCAKHDPRSKAVLTHLLDSLNDEDIELVWDRDLLEVGDAWDDKLLDAMDACEGAILLLSGTALQRPYLVKECTILAQRKRHSEKWGGNTFELLSVLIGILPEDLADPAKSHMKDLRLEAYQAGNDQDLDVLAQALKQRLERLKVAFQRGTPRQELLNDIAIQIEGSKPRADKKLARELAITLPPWIVNEASLHVRALAVAAQMPQSSIRQIGRALSESKDEIDLKAALAILDRIAPFSVPSDAAARIPGAAGDTTRARAIEVNAADIRIGQWYVRLAYGSMLRTKVAKVTDSDAGLGAARLQAEIAAAVRGAVQAETNDEAREELAAIGTPFFVFVPCVRPILEIIEPLHTDFPTITIVFLSGSKPPLAQRQPPDAIILLEPLLAEEKEKSAITGYEKAIAQVRETHA